MQISNPGSLFFLAIPSSHPLTLQSTLFSVTSVPSSSPPSRYLFFIVALVNSQWQSSWKDPCHPSWPVISAPTSPVTTLRPVILKHGTVTPLYSKSSSYGLWADGQWVMMAKAFRPCGKARPGFESVLPLMPPVKGVQTRYTHTSAPANENIRLLTKNLKRIAWSKIVRTPSSAPAVTDLQRAVVNTACPSTPPVQLNLLI